MSTLVRQLCDLEVLERTADERDRRVARLELTSDARKRLQKWRDERTALLARGMPMLDAAEKSLLAQAIPVLTRLVTTFSESREVRT